MVMRYRAWIDHRQSSCDRPYQSADRLGRRNLQFGEGRSRSCAPPLQWGVRPAQGPATDGPRVTQKPAEHTPLMKHNGCNAILGQKTFVQQWN